MGKKMLVIGGVAAGTKSAARARRLAPDLEITLITDEPYISYAGCGEPYFVGNVVQTKSQLLVRTAESFARANNLTIYTDTRAVSLDPTRKIVVAEDLNNHTNLEFHYDYLVIATGASPIIPELPGINLPGVYPIRSIDGVVSLKTEIDSGFHKKAVVVGGGFIGLEMAENLSERGIKVTLVEKLPYLGSIYDPEVSLHIEKECQKHGVNVLTSNGVIGFKAGSSGLLASVETEKGDLDATLAILAIGVTPNTQFAHKAGIELGIRNTIKVNEFLQTNIPEIYAGGDCCQTSNRITGKPTWIPLGDYANQMGRIIGTNIALQSQGKDPQMTWKGVLGTNIFRLFSLNVASTGLTQRMAGQEGYDSESVIVPLYDLPTYMPGVAEVIIKLTADRQSRKLLGAQVWGPGKVDKVIDAAATAIAMNANVDDLCNLDLAYAPPFSPAFGNLIQAAMVLQNKLTGRTNGILPLQVKELLDNQVDFVFLDVRNPDEVQKISIPLEKGINIPLPELPKRLSELDRNKLIVTSCAAGLRAAQAFRILANSGFSQVKYMDGGTRAWPFPIPL